MPQKKINYSTELMVNFKQAKSVAPQKKFEALQTDEGYSLLFSIGTDQVFYLTQQTSGTTSGWKQDDLSSLLSKNHGGKKVVAKTFAVSQNFTSRKFDVVLAISVDDTDYLYVSLNNSSNLKALNDLTFQWELIPYDDPKHTSIKLDVKNLYIAQTKNEEYIVVDISRSTFDPPADFLERYYIDPKKLSGRYWNNLSMGGDLNPGISSTLGRKDRDRVDGIYTLGSINGTTELLYAPLYNPFDRKAPTTITRLQVPSQASALAAVNVNGNLTDLFVIGEKTLYYFAADKQQDGDAGIPLMKSDLFDGVKDVFAFSDQEKYVIWGKNRANQIFYTSCLKQNITEANYWTFPVPILTGVEQLSPLLNIVDSSNVFFAVAGNQLIKAEQSPETSIWSFQKITLEIPVESKAEHYSSYTTRIQLTDNNDKVLSDTVLNISSNSRMPVLINNLYYVITPDPIAIRTDDAGVITVVEEIQDITGLQIMVSDDAGTSVVINPMNKPFEKIASLNSSSKLRDAVIVNSDGQTRKLVSADVDNNSLNQVAIANSSLSQAYKEVSENFSHRSGGLLMNMAYGNTVYLEGIGDTIVSEVGDLFRWLASGVKYVANIVKNVVTGVWHFVVQIGNKIYQGVLNCVEKVVGAVRWIYDIIKTAIKDLLKYLEFLFQWKDITRTKEVFKNLSKLYLRHQIDQVGELKTAFDGEMKKLVKICNEWGGITDWKGLGAAATLPADASSQPAKGDSAPADLLLSHFQNNVSHIKADPLVAKLNMDNQSIIDLLFDTLKKEGVIFDAVLDQIDQLVSEYQNMTLEEILKRVVAIIGSGVLETTQNIFDVLFDIFIKMLESALEILDTPIYIPVVSDILEYFGVPKVSMLDLLCYIGAVPVTVVYKMAKGAVPFPQDEFTNFLIKASTFEEVEKAFNPPKIVLYTHQKDLKVESTAVTLSVNPNQIFYVDAGLFREMKSNSLTISPENSKVISTVGNMFAGFFSLMSIFIVPFEAAAPTGENPFGTFSAVLGVLGAGSVGISSTLVPKMPIKNKVVSWINTGTTVTSILSKIVFSGPAQSKFKASPGIMNKLAAGDGRATGAIVNSILILPALFCSCWHFYELAQEKESATRSVAIINETSNMTSYISRLSYAVAVNVKDPEVKAVSIGVLVVANICTSGLQTASAIVNG
ncbi:hypothetical protein MUB18_20185 [Sphingobacterium sp. PCS056]|uniref:hypothetical protein n=1 Tax=Sphingobacterium sp. PCS056 TaxID=2931400 RepID=UPI002010A589|nr:hypothetical protein [Sphingobacterium sp. PCS056]UPZ36411.1 hypothetical protein MUB18_20185 [Sphingobacterium sp. PCS056]